MIISRRAGLLGALGAIGAALTGCSPAPAAPTASSSAQAPTSPTMVAPTPTLTQTPSPAPTPTIPAVADPLPSGVVNALIVGTDTTRDNTNTDVLVLAQLSADRTRVTLVSIPRDSYVSIPGHGKNRINAALAESGIDALKATVSGLFGGLTIHYVAQTNFNDFVTMVKLFDGFSVENRIASAFTHQDGSKTPFPQGTLTLHGDAWLFYARERKSLPRGDIDRGEKHRAIITGMLRYLQGMTSSDPLRFVSAAQAFLGTVRSYGGITGANVLGLVPALRAIKGASITSVHTPVASMSGTAGALRDLVILNDAGVASLGAGLRAGDVSAFVAAYGQP